MVDPLRRGGLRHELTGDGELQEGQLWESLPLAAHLGLDELTVIVDHNKVQSDTWVENVSSLGDLEAKVASFGWCVVRHPQGVTEMLSPGTYGHGGAYGTQAWVDPVKGVIYLLIVQRANFPNSDDSEVRKAFPQSAAEAIEEYCKHEGFCIASGRRKFFHGAYERHFTSPIVAAAAAHLRVYIVPRSISFVATVRALLQWSNGTPGSTGRCTVRLVPRRATRTGTKPAVQRPHEYWLRDGDLNG